MKPQENWDEEEVKPQEKLERREGKGGEAENSKISGTTWKQNGRNKESTNKRQINNQEIAKKL